MCHAYEAVRYLRGATKRRAVGVKADLDLAHPLESRSPGSTGPSCRHRRPARHSLEPKGIAALSTKINESIISEIQAQLKHKNVTVDVKANSDAHLSTTVTVEELGLPGLKKVMTILYPHQAFGRFEIQYLHDYAGINASSSMNTKPLVNLSAVFGNEAIAAGADVAYDAATRDFTKYNDGLIFTNADLSAVMTLNNKGDSLTASYYHLVNTEKDTAVGMEVTRNFSTKASTVTFGTRHALDPTTTVRARYNSNGMVGALIQHEWKPKSIFTLSTEVEVKVFNAFAVLKPPKIGLSLVLKP